MTQLTKKLKYQGTLKLLSCLHIGDSKENVQIGAIDAPIVRRKDNNQPYIPGSSLKGKIRCLLEQTKGFAKLGGSAEVNYLFGINAGNNQQDNGDIPSKVIFRDAYLSKDSVEALEKSEFTDYPYSEVKFENTIDRISGTADNPRKFERIPAGAEFDLEIVLNIWDLSMEDKQKDLLAEGIALLNNDYLGGAGSRGYGHIELKLEDPKQVYPANGQS